jgi:hypothetical protein
MGNRLSMPLGILLAVLYIQKTNLQREIDIKASIITTKKKSSIRANPVKTGDAKPWI